MMLHEHMDVDDKMDELNPQIRKSACAGRFYPADKQELEGEVSILLSDAKDVLSNRMKTDQQSKALLTNANKINTHKILRAIVVPHGKYDQSGIIAAQGFSLLSRFSQHDHWKVILIGPSHGLHFSGAAMSTAELWQTPLGNVRVNNLTSFMARKHYPNILALPEAHEEEHALEIQLPLLQHSLSDFSIIPMITGDISPDKLASIISPYCDDETIIVVSADLSSNHTREEAQKRDAMATNAMTCIDTEKLLRIGESCAKVPLAVLLYLAKEKGWTCELVDYVNVGTSAKDKNKVTGYGCYAFYERTEQS